MNYPDADRYIPATNDMLRGWCGPYEKWQDGMSVTNWPLPNRVDPMRPEVRDHLIRRLALPAWMRDGAGLEPWQSAGLIACAAAGQQARCLLGEWSGPAESIDGGHRIPVDKTAWLSGASHLCVYVRPSAGCVTEGDPGWAVFRNWTCGPSALDMPKHPDIPHAVLCCDTLPDWTPWTREMALASYAPADIAALAHGCALMAGLDEMWLPWPNGPRSWRRA